MRAVYEKLDLLQFENEKDSVEDPEMTPPQELVQLLAKFMAGHNSGQAAAAQ